MATEPLSIGLLTHSVNPRGGVVHVLELGRALSERGHRVTVFAPAARGQGLFRETPCRVVLVPVSPAGPSLAATVRERVAAFVACLSRRLRDERFDVLHAHDGIGGNALADLQQAGLVRGHVRTVHHLDRFDDPQVQAWEQRAIEQATLRLCVSATWREHLQARFGLAAEQVGNGVDLGRFTPWPQPGDDAVAARWGLRGVARRAAGQGAAFAPDAETPSAGERVRGAMHPQAPGAHGPSAPVVLSVGGIEARKNTLRLLQAFIALRRRRPAAQLVIAGGASLLNHDRTTAAFLAEAAQGGLTVGPGGDVVLTGPVDDAALPALYRRADVLAMPSLLEGFGLAALEALACGTPAVVSRQPPFTEHFAAELVWAEASSADAPIDGPTDTLARPAPAVQGADPLSVPSIAEALERALVTGRHAAVPPVCHRYSWAASAARHEALYRAQAERSSLSDDAAAVPGGEPEPPLDREARPGRHALCPQEP